MKKLIEQIRRVFRKRVKYYEYDTELNIILYSVQNDFGP